MHLVQHGCREGGVTAAPHVDVVAVQQGRVLNVVMGRCAGDGWTSIGANIGTRALIEGERGAVVVCLCLSGR
jgi:hypothetical protein